MFSLGFPVKPNDGRILFHAGLSQTNRGAQKKPVFILASLWKTTPKGATSKKDSHIWSILKYMRPVQETPEPRSKILCVLEGTSKPSFVMIGTLPNSPQRPPNSQLFRPYRPQFWPLLALSKHIKRGFWEGFEGWFGGG